MSNPFFDHPILNSPYECPSRHWELDDDGQPTQKVIESRHSSEFAAPIPRLTEHHETSLCGANRACQTN